MPYAEGRAFRDADSHIMELPDFLRRWADPGIRDRLPDINFDSGGKLRLALDRLVESGAHEQATVDELTALGDGLLAGPKGYEALGAFNAAERSTALDLLGFERQLVFATFSPSVSFAEGRDPDVVCGACRAHNRAMSAFCADDPRLIGVATVCLDDPERAAAELDHAIGLGLGAVWIPHRPAGGRSPGHDDLDPIWARLEDAGVPFLLHVGGAAIQVAPEWMNTGRPQPTDWLGGGENVRGKDMIGLHHQAELFVGTMVFDGVLERFPRLRGGVIELGAGWVPALLRRLDLAAQIWRKSEPELAALTRTPSEQIVEQMAFTPYPFEDVGAMIRESHPDLYLFSSDYPHMEGGRNPLARFDASLGDLGDDIRARFYSENFASLVGAR
jgi:predicted TIM-barrel fold metal-dependent hydrolase